MRLRIINLIYTIGACLMMATSQYELGSMVLLFAIFFNVSEFAAAWLEDRNRV